MTNTNKKRRPMETRWVHEKRKAIQRGKSHCKRKGECWGEGSAEEKRNLKLDAHGVREFLDGDNRIFQKPGKKKGKKTRI